jgi:L-arabinose transport system permease protein
MSDTVTLGPPGGRPVRQCLAGLWQNSGMLVVLLVLVAGAAAFVPNFASLVNFKGLALMVATVGIIACTMLLCLASGDFDLSVGSVVAMSGVMAAVVVNATGSVPLGIAAGLAAGALVGLVNGTVIAILGVNALITTLATMQIVRGVSYIVSQGKAIGVREEGFYALGNTAWPRFDGYFPTLSVTYHAGFPWAQWSFGFAYGDMSIPTPVWIMLGGFVFFGLLLNWTTFGRNTLAIVGNAEASRLAGIAVARTKIVIFALQGLVAGFAGVILASRMTSGQPTTGQGLELQVISACVLGGVSLTGGVGTMLGVVVGVLIMGTAQNAMNLCRIPPFYQYVASGGILLAAVLIDRLKQRRSR